VQHNKYAELFTDLNFIEKKFTKIRYFDKKIQYISVYFSHI